MRLILTFLCIIFLLGCHTLRVDEDGGMLGLGLGQIQYEICTTVPDNSVESGVTVRCIKVTEQGITEMGRDVVVDTTSPIFNTILELMGRAAIP